MTYPPGQGKSGQHLMELWRKYLEEYADKEADIESQAIVGAYYSVEVLIAFSRTLDRENRYRDLIDQRLSFFEKGRAHARTFADCLLNGTFAIYNSLNTLGHQFTEGNEQAAELIRGADQQVHRSTESGAAIERSAAALRASFALLGLIAITLDQKQEATPAIRKIEQKFASGAKAASSDWDHLLNALYRIVEIMQILALLTDPNLKDRIHQIASRFKEEDQEQDLRLKLRNGFCRLFEFAHLLITQVDTMV
jgi:hypothetical protein